MNVGLNKYGRALVLQACVFRHVCKTKSGMSSLKFNELRTLLLLNNVNLKDMRFLERPDGTYLEDFDIFSLEDNLKDLVNHVQDEFKKSGGLNYVTYILVKKINSFNSGLILTENFQPDIHMQLKNLLLANKIVLERNGFWAKEDAEYGQYIVQSIAAKEKKAKKLFEDLKNADFS